MEKLSINMDDATKSTPPSHEIEESVNPTSKQSLIPQPSTDPADPLNWPMVLKV